MKVAVMQDSHNKTKKLYMPNWFHHKKKAKITEENYGKAKVKMRQTYKKQTQTM
jgi:hypothetical protein